MSEDEAITSEIQSSALSEVTAMFVVYLEASGCSPNTTRAYGHDLTHLDSFLVEQDLDWRALTPAQTRTWESSFACHDRGRASRPAPKRGDYQQDAGGGVVVL